MMQILKLKTQFARDSISDLAGIWDYEKKNQIY